MAAGPGGHDAVEHVDAPAHRLDDVVRGAHPHEIAGLFLRHVRLDRLDHAQHHVLGLADGEPADGIPFQVQGREFLRALDAQPLHRSALNDAEHGFAGLFAESHPAALGPAQRQAHGLLGHLIGTRQLHAFVELHLDI
jgi:hypothetical protein